MGTIYERPTSPLVLCACVLSARPGREGLEAGAKGFDLYRSRRSRQLQNTKDQLLQSILLISVVVHLLYIASHVSDKICAMHQRYPEWAMFSLFSEVCCKAEDFSGADCAGSPVISKNWMVYDGVLHILVVPTSAAYKMSHWIPIKCLCHDRGNKERILLVS